MGILLLWEFEEYNLTDSLSCDTRKSICKSSALYIYKCLNRMLHGNVPSIYHFITFHCILFIADYITQVHNGNKSIEEEQ